jgi:hypothetical protein
MKKWRKSENENKSMWRENVKMKIIEAKMSKIIEMA